MDSFDRFEQLIQEDPQLTKYLKDLVGNELIVEDSFKPKQYDLGSLSPLTLPCIYGMWRLFKIGFDYLQGVSIREQAKMQNELALELVQIFHMDFEKAHAIVSKMYNDIQNRSQDDSILAKLLSYFTKTQD